MDRELKDILYGSLILALGLMAPVATSLAVEETSWKFVSNDTQNVQVSTVTTIPTPWEQTAQGMLNRIGR